MKLFDVIIPAYNSEKTIGQTIESLENSGLDHFSIIVINDGSTDATEEKCLSLTDKYHNIRYFAQKNKGVSAARNFGITQSDAEYIILFDADDSVNPNAFLRAEQIVRRIKPDMLIYGMSFEYYRKGKLFRKEELVYPWEGLLSQDAIQEHFSELYEVNAFTSSCNKIIRRELVINNGIRYDENVSLMEDFMFSLDCVHFCENIYMLPEPIYRYRQSEGKGHVYDRIRCIGSLTDYMELFRKRLVGHPDVLSSVYYMMLRQKLWMSKTKEIRMIAQDHVRSEIPAYNSADMYLDHSLKEREYTKIRCHNLLLQLRHRLANMIKSTRLFQRFEMKKNGHGGKYK